MEKRVRINTYVIYAVECFDIDVKIFAALERLRIQANEKKKKKKGHRLILALDRTQKCGG